MNININDIKNGMTIIMDNNLYQIVEFQHVKPGKGAAFVRTKLKNVISGAVLEKTFNPSEKYPGAEIEKREMQYLVNKGVRFGENGISHTTARHRRNYWCTENKKCMSLLNEYRKRVTK